MHLREGDSGELIVKFAESSCLDFALSTFAVGTRLLLPLHTLKSGTVLFGKVYEVTGVLVFFCIATNGLISEKYLPDVHKYVLQRCLKLNNFLVCMFDQCFFVGPRLFDVFLYPIKH